MRTYFIVLLLIFSAKLNAQNAEYQYFNKSDSTYNCYLSILPDSIPIKGLIIRDYSSLPDINKQSPYQWSNLALQNGFAILYTVSSNFFPELYYSESEMKVLDNLVVHAVKRYKIPKQNIFIGGISASGTRAMKYTQFCNEGKSKSGLKIKGVFSIDSPLDLERFYYSVHRNKKYFKKGMLWEANLMTKVFKKKMGGAPEYNLLKYRKASVYSHLDSTGGNAKHLLNTNVLLIHEPDIDWWLNERGATYYDFNSFDLAGLAKWLISNGSNQVTHITTTGKGYDRKGNRNCHSWTIVDELYLISWINDLCD